MNSSIAEKILAYLVDHPDAQDTVEGIAHWWVLERYIQEEVAEVQVALGELVERGLVVERAGHDARILYQLDQSKLPKVRRILAGQS